MWVAKRMGHRDWTITAKKYARRIPSIVPDAGARAAMPGGSPAQRSVTIQAWCDSIRTVSEVTVNIWSSRCPEPLWLKA